MPSTVDLVRYLSSRKPAVMGVNRPGVTLFRIDASRGRIHGNLHHGLKPAMNG